MGMYFKKWKDFILVTEEVNNNQNSQDGTQGSNANTNVNNSGTSGNNKENISLLTPKELQVKLDDWNANYSQSFKFLNNKPSDVKEENTINELLINISDNYKTKTKDGIDKFINFLSNEKIIKSFENKELLILGYTSSTGSDSYNQALSLRRAKIVANAIKSLLKANNINIKINIKEEGMGETENGRIVINDDDLDPVKLSPNAPKLSDETLELIKTSKEERQKLNRRVKITLPGFEFVETVIEPESVKPTEEVKKEVINKPEIPVANTIDFNLNSFILRKNSQSILSSFSDELKKWNEKNKDNDTKIKNIYISAHTMLGKGDGKKEKEDLERAKKSTAILAANRAQLVKDYIKGKLGEENVKDLNFYCYPVAFKMGTVEKKVVITFEETEHMKTAKTQFESLSSEYNLPKGENGLKNLEIYLKNEAMYNVLEKNIKASITDGDNYKYIPLELWYDKLEGYYGFTKYSTERENFKAKFEKIISKENKRTGRDYTLESFVYEPE